MFRGLVLALVLISPAFAQVDVAVEKAKSLVGVTNARSVGDRVLVGYDSKPAISNVAILTVKTDWQYVDIDVTRGWGQLSSVEKLPSDKGVFTWVVMGAGDHKAVIFASDPAKGPPSKSYANFSIEPDTPVDPKPPVDPTPVVDQVMLKAFQTAYTASTEAGKADLAKSLANLYRQGAASALTAKSSQEVYSNMASVAAAIGVKGKLTTVQQAISAQLQANGVLGPSTTAFADADRSRFVDVFTRVAGALEAVK